MKKETITVSQGACQVALLSLGSALMVGVSRESQQDAWIALLLAVAALLPILWLYARILSRYPGQNLFDLCHTVFGKIAGKIIVALFIYEFFLVGAFVLRMFSEYLEVRVFPQMPQTISLLSLAVLSIWAARRGIEPAGRAALFLLPVVLIVVLVTTAMLGKDLHPSYLLPIGEHLDGIPMDVFRDFCHPLGDVVVFLALFNTMKQGSKPGKALLLGVLAGTATLLLTLMRNYMALGDELEQAKFFPSYDATSLIIAGTFVSRIENIMGAALVVTLFIKAALYLMAAAKGVAALFGEPDYRPYVAPVGLVMAAAGAILYSSMMEMFSFYFSTYAFFAFPFQVILPIVVCAGAEVKLALAKKGGQKGPQPQKAG